MKAVARFFLWLATIWWGVWFGGQLFNALMVVPHFSAHPPESLTAWGEMRFDNAADFFVIFAPLWTFLFLVLALLLDWRNAAARGWIVTSAIIAVVCMTVLLGWMVPTISQLVRPDHGGVTAAQIAAHLKQWTMANCARLVLDFGGFVTAVKALTGQQT